MALVETTAQVSLSDDELAAVQLPINGDAAGKNLLSMWQLSEGDIRDYLDEAYAAEAVMREQGGINLLPFRAAKAIMQQPSTRTGGSFTTAMQKLGGAADLISGMSSSSEAKGESPEDSWVAFATQADILGIRTATEMGPVRAAHAIATALNRGQLWQMVPIINLGNGTNEHPTQALGDLFTIHKEFGQIEGLTIAVVGDHLRYRAHHSLLIGSVTMGANVIAVEAPVAPVPKTLADALGSNLLRTNDLDEAMRVCDVLYMGRNPDEYGGEDPAEQERSRQLAKVYESWVVDNARLQRMPKNAIGMHPRPRRNELHPSVDVDPRMRDIEQMANMIPMRMAIIARHMGMSIVEASAR
jgi:aspartate carbamoyltransferase catalytic subunit